jgi:hypothetical protein
MKMEKFYGDPLSDDVVSKNNYALRVAEEEARQTANGTWKSEARFTLSKSSWVAYIREKADKEFAAIQDYLSGKISEPKKIYTFCNKRYENSLLYFEYPEDFEEDIADLYDEKRTHGDLCEEDMAWIENTRLLIAKYHGIVYKGETEKPVVKPAARKTASKVCTIANRIPRSVSRKEAFTTAWSIVKSGGFEIGVAGVTFGNRQKALSRLATYDPKDIIAVLVPEPDNRHDPEAIAVKVMVNGGRGIYTLGYVPKTDARLVKAFLGTAPELRLVGGETKGARLRLAA